MIDKRNALMKLAYGASTAAPNPAAADGYAGSALDDMKAGTQPKVNWPTVLQPVMVGSTPTTRVRQVPKDQIPSYKMQAEMNNPKINTEARRAEQAASYGIKPKPPAPATTPPATQATAPLQYPSWMQYQQ